MTATYADFLAEKAALGHAAGVDVAPDAIDPRLRDWQREIVSWALRVGRAAIWADTGLGKTFMQLAWLDQMLAGRMARGLIVAPFAVCHQTAYAEAPKLGLEVAYVRSAEEATAPGIYVTNYEMLDRFDPADFDAVVLDEASILKQSDGRTRTRMIEWADRVPYRLACTATPAPNDPEELTNYAEFLGHMKRVEMLAAYYVHDQDGWRMKGHARGPLYQWMATWALAIRKPSDLGDFDDQGYDLPGLEIVPHIVEAEAEPDDQAIFGTTLGGVSDRARVRKETLAARCEAAAAIVNAEPDEPWLIWCGLNDEADLMASLTGGINVHGSLSVEAKADGLLGFAAGRDRVIVTKPAIASQGLNYQHCARMVFVGLSDSYEQYYQAIRRCYRFGQQRIVQAHVVLSDVEAAIAANVSRKEAEAGALTRELVAAMRAAREDHPS